MAAPTTEWSIRQVLDRKPGMNVAYLAVKLRLEQEQVEKALQSMETARPQRVVRMLSYTETTTWSLPKPGWMAETDSCMNCGTTICYDSSFLVGVMVDRTTWCKGPHGGFLVWLPCCRECPPVLREFISETSSEIGE